MGLTVGASFRLIEDGQVLSADDLRARAEVFPKAVRIYGADERSVAGLIVALIAAYMQKTDLFVQRVIGASTAVSEGASSARLWLQTSGTTGSPKWAGHDLARLTAAITPGTGGEARWLLTYHPFSFAGIQVILSALIGGHTLIAPPEGADVAVMAQLADHQQATHMSGTPTFWRAFLMSAPSDLFLRTVTLGGEAVDQGLLDALRARFPAAHIRHIYATTEAGVILTVSDGQAGFPESALGGRLALSEAGTLLVDGHDTRDVVHVENGRVRFRGRLDSLVNIGGVKVFPEEVEAWLALCPAVADARVWARPNPITGHVLSAEIALVPGADESEVKVHIQGLPRTSRPVGLRFVESITRADTGKKSRAEV
ncbi:AMP-binding protein [Asticcacaulis sp. W401b]|uniref:AMP-binding protein n=1 Tax=Asticcacaulis sp. W401b TaxID=3388666 RepID=UPI00397073E9